MKTLVLGILKMMGQAVVSLILSLLTQDLFEDVARASLRKLLLAWKDSTENDLDDEIVAEVIARLDRKPAT